ncbi:MAG: hypothetical protein ABL931_22195, partial [Usitatibacteraceae bacterium]
LWIALGLFIVWRLYSRIRRLIGRQRSRAFRHWAAAIFFPLLVVLVAVGAMRSPLAEGALLAGVACGVALAVWGLRLTKFEKTDLGFFYTPNAHIGIAISLLFIARIGYRFMQMSALTSAEARLTMQDFGRSPLTLVIFGVMAGYYAWYAVGLIRWRSSGVEPTGVPVV